MPPDLPTKRHLEPIVVARQALSSSLSGKATCASSAARTTFEMQTTCFSRNKYDPILDNIVIPMEI
jgi:hypothetical protein